MKHTINYRKTDKLVKRGQAQTLIIKDEGVTVQKVSVQYSKQGQFSIHVKKAGKEWELLKNVITTKVDNLSYVPVLKIDEGKLQIK